MRQHGPTSRKPAICRRRWSQASTTSSYAQLATTERNYSKIALYNFYMTEGNQSTENLVQRKGVSYKMS